MWYFMILSLSLFIFINYSITHSLTHPLPHTNYYPHYGQYQFIMYCPLLPINQSDVFTRAEALLMWGWGLLALFLLLELWLFPCLCSFVPCLIKLLVHQKKEEDVFTLPSFFSLWITKSIHIKCAKKFSF